MCNLLLHAKLCEDAWTYGLYYHTQPPEAAAAQTRANQVYFQSYAVNVRPALLAGTEVTSGPLLQI
jgi:hypothetical protein